MNAPASTSPIATAMAVLRCFSTRAPVLGVVDIAQRIGLHKSSVSRVLATLETEGLVEQDPQTRKYRLGLGLLQVAGPLLAGLDVRRAALPVLAELVCQTQETCSLMVWDGQAAVSVEQIPSPQPVKHSAELGSRYASPQSSSVRIFLRELGSEANPRTLAEPGELTVLDDEFTAVNLGLTRPDEVGIAAAVRDHRGKVVGALLISAPRYRVDDVRLAELRRACYAAAQQITTHLGGA